MSKVSKLNLQLVGKGCPAAVTGMDPEGVNHAGAGNSTG